MRVRGLIWFGGIAIVATALTPAAAGAMRLGPSFSAGDADYGAGCSGANCIVMQRKLPGATLKAPFSGRVKKWSFRSPGPYTYALIVLRPDGSGGFELIRASDSEHAIAQGKWTFSTNLRIRKGDRVGIYMSAPGIGNIGIRDNPAATYAVFEPPPLIGGSGSPGSPIENEALYNATLKR